MGTFILILIAVVVVIVIASNSKNNEKSHSESKRPSLNEIHFQIEEQGVNVLTSLKMTMAEKLNLMKSDYALRAHLLNNAATFAACKQEKNLWE